MTTLRRYNLPSIQGSGWAIFVIDTKDGYFSAISDFGNYGYLWTHHGCADFRDFLLRPKGSADYFIRKLSPGKEFDPKETWRETKNAIVEILADAKPRRAAQCKEALADLEAPFHDREDYERWISDHDDFFHDNELHVHACQRHPRMVERFVNEAMARLADVLKAELLAERAGAPAEAT